MERHISLASQLPKGDPRRDDVARQILDARRRERKGDFNTNRNLDDYISILKGLEHFFDYTRNVGQSSLILDIGAGKMRALHALSQSSLGSGLTFRATTLLPSTKSDNSTIASSRTSVELMRGIDDASVAGILAVYSVCYSNDPELAVANIDRVLAPGGAFKGKFHRGSEGVLFNEGGYRTHKGFTDVFSSLGYDVAFRDEDGIAIAVRPPFSGERLAELLLLQDTLSYLGDVMHTRIQQRGHPI